MDKISWWWEVMALPWLKESPKFFGEMLDLLGICIALGCLGYLIGVVKDRADGYKYNNKAFYTGRRTLYPVLAVLSVVPLMYAAMFVFGNISTALLSGPLCLVGALSIYLLVLIKKCRKTKINNKKAEASELSEKKDE